MIGRLLGGGITLLIYFCAATFLAQAVVGAYLCKTWGIDRPRLARIVAAARGAEAPSMPAGGAAPADPAGEEQPSHSEVVAARAARSRDLELKELALASAVEQLRFDTQRLAENEARHKTTVAAFETELAALRESAEARGRTELSRILETLKSKQAKDQLMAMLEKGEVEDVVMLLMSISERPRAKIIAELKTEEENKKLSEVLERIRQGEPESPLAARTLGQLGAPGAARE